MKAVGDHPSLPLQPNGCARAHSEERKVERIDLSQNTRALRSYTDADCEDATNTTINSLVASHLKKLRVELMQCNGSMGHAAWLWRLLVIVQVGA